MFYVYILKSISADRFYVGHTANIDNRLIKHNSGSVKSTKPFRPWILVYSNVFNTRSEAVKEELRIKNMKSRKYIETLIDEYS